MTSLSFEFQSPVPLYPGDTIGLGLPGYSMGTAFGEISNSASCGSTTLVPDVRAFGTVHSAGYSPVGSLGSYSSD
jgi:hypothetical protein